MLHVPGTKLYFKTTPNGSQYSDDNGVTWYNTFRTKDEWMDMHKTAIQVNQTNDTVNQTNDDELRETLGETLDEPISDDLVELWNSLG